MPAPLRVKASRERVDQEKAHRRSREQARNGQLPQQERNAEVAEGEEKTRVAPGIYIKKKGDAGRRGIHPFHFFRIIWHSSSRLSRAVNILWPVAIAAIAVGFTEIDNVHQHVIKFTLAYVGMIPAANLIGFAGQQLAQKLPHMLGILVETSVASIVEIVLFMILLKGDQIMVVKAAILGSILANMVLCLGLIFFTSGLKRETSHFHEAISEVGSNLLLIAGLGLAIPTIFTWSLTNGEHTTEEIEVFATHLSHGIAVMLLVAYAVYIFFQTRTHHSIYNDIFEMDEERDEDGHKDTQKDRLTLTECIVALLISVAFVSAIAYILVSQIHHIVVEQHVSDLFMGLILVPLVEKAAEHLTAIDEAWDNQINFALSHVIGATIQTAMFNAPLVVIASWGIGERWGIEHGFGAGMNFVFETFDITVLILSVITVGGFLRDEKSDYLEGFLSVVLYICIAIAAFWYPNSQEILSAEH